MNSKEQIKLLEKIRRDITVLFPSKMRKIDNFNICFDSMTDYLSIIIYNINKLIEKKYSFDSKFCINKLINVSKGDTLSIDFFKYNEKIGKFFLHSGLYVSHDLNLNLNNDHSPLVLDRNKMLNITSNIKGFSNIFEKYVYKELDKINIKYQKELDSASIQIKNMIPLILKLKEYNLNIQHFIPENEYYTLKDIHDKIYNNLETIRLLHDLDLSQEISILSKNYNSFSYTKLK